MPPLTEVNKLLLKNYGKNLAGQPLFRVVWAGDQTEKRFGVYNEFYGSIFLREIRGLREVPKYPYIKDRYILEKWIPPMIAYTPDIPETSQGSYEPVFTFEDALGEPIPVVYEKLERIIYTMMHPNLAGHQKSLDQTADEDAFEREVQFNKNVLEEGGRTWMGHRLHSKEGVSLYVPDRG